MRQPFLFFAMYYYYNYTQLLMVLVDNKHVYQTILPSSWENVGTSSDDWLHEII